MRVCVCYNYRFDTGKDGYLDLGELKRMMEKLGVPQTHLALKAMIKEVDEDGDDKISFREVSYKICKSILNIDFLFSTRVYNNLRPIFEKNRSIFSFYNSIIYSSNFNALKKQKKKLTKATLKKKQFFTFLNSLSVLFHRSYI